MRTVRTRRGFLQEYPGTRTQTPSSSPDPFSCYEMQPGLNKKLQVCPTICLTLGVHPKNCAQFCATAGSKSVPLRVSTARRLASIRICEYRSIIARETCPARAIMVESEACDSAR